MNIKDYMLKVIYLLDGKEFCITGNDSVLSFVDNGNENSVHIVMSAKAPVKIVLAELIYDHYFENNEQFFANGYQSWTTSREYKKGDTQYGLRNVCKLPFFKKFATVSGDYAFTEYGRDMFHSFTYTYFRRNNKIELFGTLNDRTGYTIFYGDFRENVFAIIKEVEGLEVSDSYNLFDIITFEGAYDTVFDKYFAAYPEKATGRIEHLAGYTSWYNYFQNINEEIILRDLEGIKKVGSAAGIFQIDDGYETKIGDWVVDPNKFPNGMKPIAEAIHKQNLLAGIWVAPFSAQRSADIVKQHPEWLLKKSNGKPVIAGIAWNGFYALDIELEEVKEYIKKYFNQIFNDWGFDMVKLDFLYSECIFPRNGKTRGQIMHEAMDFLRECCGDKIMLGCGVPLGPSFGKVDACRISCDVDLSFKEKFFVKITNQEVISTKNALNNSIFRRHLNGRIFANDTDVFFLRNDGMRSADYSLEQKKLLAKVNHMFGGVLFVSDNIGAYNQTQMDILLASYKKFEGKILLAEYIDSDNIAITFKQGNKKQILTLNLLTGANDTKSVQ